MTLKKMQTKLEAVAITFIVTLFLCSCDGSSEKQAVGDKKFILPEIPKIITDPGQRAEFLVSHYWDNFDFADTTLINNPDLTEQAFVDYISMFPNASFESVGKGISDMLSKSIDGGMDMFRYFANLYDKYLYEPNSPFRQEDYYILVLKGIIGNAKLEDVEKVRSRARLDMAMLNRPGDIAADFEFTLPNDKVMHLSDVNSEYVIIFFNNPDCHDCARVKGILSGIDNPKIKIVAIYPDEDIEVWSKAVYPSGWINGRNSTIRKDRSYDLRAIPNLYILDKDKRVVAKDVQVEAIFEYLHSVDLSDK